MADKTLHEPDRLPAPSDSLPTDQVMSASGERQHLLLSDSWGGRALEPPGLSRSPDPRSLLKALRRRWAVGFSLGLVLGAAVAVGIWSVWPPKYSAQALLEVSLVQPTLVQKSAGEGGGSGASSVYQRTQVELVKSRLVLGAALSDAKLAQLPTIQEQPDPIDWLVKKLDVEFVGGSEVLRIGLTGNRPSDIALIANAVAKAYLKKAANRDVERRQDRMRELDNVFAQYMEVLRGKRRALRETANALGTGNQETANFSQQLYFDRLSSLRKDLWALKLEMTKAQAESTATDSQAKNKGPTIPDALITESLENDSQLQKQQYEVTTLQEQIDKAKQALVNPDDASLAPLQKQLTDARKAVDLRKKSLRKSLRDRMLAKIKGDQQIAMWQGHQRVAVYEALQKELTNELAHLEKDMSLVKSRTFDLETLREELTRVEKITDRIGDEKEALAVELRAPPRAAQIDQAEAHEDAKNKQLQIVAASGGGIGTLAVVLLGIALLEFRTRRVEDEADLTHGLGLDVVGTLPIVRQHRRLLGNRGAMDDSGGGQSVLVESVDTIRTVLLRESREHGVRAVMVSSALPGEGKTSLSSSLALSLSRAGRKTLLVDADLRNPSLHRVFDLEAGPGLGDVLQGRQQLAEAIRPTPFAGLSIITAGSAPNEAVASLPQVDLTALVRTMKKDFDFVVVDSSPVLWVNDPLIIGQHVDAVVFSVLRNVSRMPSLYGACQRLRSLGINVLGAVFSGVSTSASYGMIYPAPTEVNAE